MLEKVQEATGFCGALAQRPQLRWYLQPIWNAFWRLSNAREHGATGFPQPISMQAIAAYSSMMEVTDIEEFIEFIQSMDNSYLNHASRKHRAKR